MNYIKSNLALFCSSIISVILFTIFLVISIYYKNSNEETASVEENEKNSIKAKESQMLPYVALDHDLLQADKDLEQIAQKERAQNRLWDTVLSTENNLSINWEKKDSELINSTLIRQFTRLRKLCREKGILLPGTITNTPTSPFLAPSNTTSQIEFGFGFKSYDGNWPNFSTDEAQKLGVQMSIIKQLVEFLAKSSSNDRSIRLISILREPVGPIDNRNILDDKLELDIYNSKLLKSQNLINSMCFHITFTGITSHARTFMNQLSPPYLLRDFAVTRELSNSLSSQLTNQNQFDSSFTTPETSELPIVQDVSSKYSFLIEYVVNVNRDHDAFYKELSDYEEVDIDIIASFLEKAGHSKMIQSLIQYIKDRDDT